MASKNDIRQKAKFAFNINFSDVDSRLINRNMLYMIKWNKNPFEFWMPKNSDELKSFNEIKDKIN